MNHLVVYVSRPIQWWSRASRGLSWPCAATSSLTFSPPTSKAHVLKASSLCDVTTPLLLFAPQGDCGKGGKCFRDVQRQPCGRFLCGKDDDVINTIFIFSSTTFCFFFVFSPHPQAVTGGIVRGAGKQTVGALCSLVGYYVVGFPIGVSLMFPINLGIFGERILSHVVDETECFLFIFSIILITSVVIYHRTVGGIPDLCGPAVPLLHHLLVQAQLEKSHRGGE